MGRKIPARKHFGIRDPIKQAEDRYALIKDKINNPPEKRDFQKVSHSLARFIKLKEAAKKDSSQAAAWKKPKRTVTGNEDKPENYTKKNKNKKKNDSRNDKDLESLKQRPNESDRNFMRRVNRVTQESVEEAKFEAKYGVEVHRDKKTGEIKLKKRPPNEIDERLKQNAQNSKQKGRKTQEVISIAPEERKKLAKAMIEEKKQKEKEAKTPVIEEFKRDEFKFGEVVNAPPQLTVPRLAKKAETVPRPGRKSLLLRSVIEEYSKKDDNVDDDSQKEKKIDKKNKISKTQTNSLKGKRKDLSMAMRKMIESEQDNVVKLYKQLKKDQRLLTKSQQTQE